MLLYPLERGQIKENLLPRCSPSATPSLYQTTVVLSGNNGKVGRIVLLSHDPEPVGEDISAREASTPWYHQFSQ